MLNKVLLVLALVCFILAAAGVEVGAIGLVPAGLALWVATKLNNG